MPDLGVGTIQIIMIRKFTHIKEVNTIPYSVWQWAAVPLRWYNCSVGEPSRGSGSFRNPHTDFSEALPFCLEVPVLISTNAQMKPTTRWNITRLEFWSKSWHHHYFPLSQMELKDVELELPAPFKPIKIKDFNHWGIPIGDASLHLSITTSGNSCKHFHKQVFMQVPSSDTSTCSNTNSEGVPLSFIQDYFLQK